MSECTLPAPEPPENVLQKLKQAGSAEEMFALLAIPYDPQALNVARLHILKRMGEYLASEDVEGLPNRMAGLRCRAVLERAYDDFVSAKPIDERVFKVLRNAVAPSPPVNFVAFEDLLK